MKQVLFFIAVFFATATVSFAQDNNEPVPDHDYAGSEVIIGHGFLPSEQMFSGNMNRYEYKNNQFTGAIFATYRYHISDIISLGMAFAFENEQGTFTSNNNYYYPSYSSYAPPNGKYRRSSYTFAPEITFNYGDYGHGLVRLYSVIGMGYTFRNEVISYNGNSAEYMSPNAKPVHFNAYGSPFGIRFGRQLSGFFEIGMGYKGVLNYGLTYRF